MPPIEVPGYILGEFLGGGSQSAVFRAREAASGRDCVAKIIRPCDAAGSGGVREVNRVLNLRHPNIVQFEDFFYLEDGWTVLVYEYVSGGSLRDRLEVGGLGLSSVVRWLDEVLAALVFLHGRGIIHCDVKPENVLLEPFAGGREVCGGAVAKLGDLGSARWVHGGVVARRVEGTPAYMAPERFGGSFGFSSDLYSVGVMAFELLTGERPFEGTVRELAQAHVRRSWDETRLAGCPLGEWVRSLLAKDPADRPSSASEARRLLRLAPVGVEGVEGSAVLGGLGVLEGEPPVAGGGSRVGTAAVRVVGDWGDFELAASLPVERAPVGVWVVGGRDWRVVLGYDSHLEVVNPLGKGSTVAFLARTGPAVGLAVTGEVYFGGSRRVRMWSGDAGGPVELPVRCERVLDLCVSFCGRLVAWTEPGAVGFWDEERGRLESFSLRLGGLNPLAVVWPDGSFGATDGALRDQLDRWGPGGGVLSPVMLPGPALATEAVEGGVLVLCLDLQRRGCYALAKVSCDGSVLVTRLPLGVGAYTLTRSGLVFQDGEGRLNRVSLSGECLAIPGSPLEFVQQLAVSPTGEAMLWLSGAPGAQQLQLWIRSNGGLGAVL